MWWFFISLFFCLFSNGLCATPNVTVRFCREQHSATNQQWQYVQNDNTIRPLGSDLCLTNEKNGSRTISITPCVPGLNFYQVWSLRPESGEINDLIGKCLGVHYVNLLKQSVQLTPCTGKNNQHWIWNNITGGILQTRQPIKQCLTAVI